MNPNHSTHLFRLCRRGVRLAVATLAAAALGGCVSVKQMAINQLGNVLAGGGTVFSGDDDPELVKAAVPFSLKLMESLLAQAPVLLNCSGMRRWSLLTVWVVEPRRTSANDAAGESVVTAMLVPCVAAAGAVWMTGRVAGEPSSFSR